MKKILFTFLSALALFSSCSSDNDTFTENVSDSNNEAKYTVNFDIKSDAFEVDKTPLRSLTDTESYLQMIVYKEAGEAYSDTVLLGSEIQKIISEEGALPLSLNLPEGKYHLAFIHNPSLPTAVSNTPLVPKNFYQDIETGGGNPSYQSYIHGANQNNYYQTIDITVDANVQNQTIPIVLEPMWSMVKFIIEDLDEYIVPTYAEYIQIDIEPIYKSYSLATKLAVMPDFHYWGMEQGLDGYELIKMNHTVTLPVSKTTAENNSLTIKINLASDMRSGPNILFRYTFDLDTQVENGLNYVVKAKGNFLESGSSSMGVTIEPFDDSEDINLPFE